MNDDIDVLLDVSDTDAETEEEKSLTTNIYSEIRLRLAKKGVPPEEIAFIHDARDSQQRAALFKAVNEGKIRVLLGSNEKMGTGLNVQERCVATHHITPPWRPGDLEQQIGRMWRQGNIFPTVFCFTHITERSFDGYIWQLLENKAVFISQIMNGSLADREVDDISDTVLTFSEIKGLASGNPKIMQKVVLDAEYARMTALRSAWISSMQSIRNDIRWHQAQLERDRHYLNALQEAIGIRNANTTDEFVIELIKDETVHIVKKREDAGREIKLLAEQAAQKILKSSVEAIKIGHYRGFALWSTCTNIEGSTAVPLVYFEVGGRKIEIGGTDNVGITRSLDMALKALDEKAKKVEESIAITEKNIASSEEALIQPWEHEKKFHDIEEELQALEKELQATNTDTPVLGRSNNFQRTTDDVRDALMAIKEMMNTMAPSRLANEEQPIPLTTESLAALGEEIKRLQSLYDFGTAVQLSLFGDAPVQPKKRRQ
ncbi:MAG: hypothetical protein HRF47_10240 [Chloroflexota bacterium]|jgi:hypothetical protein